MAGTIVVDRIESDASYASNINVASQITFSNTVTMTVASTFPAGTVGAPSITTTGDTNTGIFFSAADTIDFAEGGTATGQFDSSGNFKFNSGFGSVATAYGCRAWVNFNGIGTVAIRGSGNISSITDNGVGRYTLNFTTAMPDANYSVGAIVQNIDEMGIMIDGVYDTTPAVMSTTALKIDTARSSTTYDCTTVCVQIFR